MLGSNNITYKPGVNSAVQFWKDIWLDNCSLSVSFPQLYAKCVNKDIWLVDVIHSQGQQIIFCDVLTGVCLQEWNHILATLVNSHLPMIVINWLGDGNLLANIVLNPSTISLITKAF